MESSDPLADVPPPRHAVESDDEDEYNPSSGLPSRLEDPPEVKVEFKSVYDIPSKQPLILASGEAAVSWENIVDLGAQHAGIYVNNLPVGLLFCPSWTSTVIVVSEAETRTRLPFFAMATYTTAIIDRLQPTSVAILDSYPAKVYISPRVVSPDSTPIRYLSVGGKPVPDSRLELFATPNLLQSTTASLLNELFLRSISEDSSRGTTAAILLPSPKVPPPPPVTFDRRATTAGDMSDTNWDRRTLENTHHWLFEIVGEKVDESSLRSREESSPRLSVSPRTTRSNLREIGEGSLYL